MLPSKNHFSHWPLLKSLLEQGIFCYLDLYFAKKMLPFGPENQALLLAILFSISRQGHLSLHLENTSLQKQLRAIGLVDIPHELISSALTTLPDTLIDRNAQEMDKLICLDKNLLYLQKYRIQENQILSSLLNLLENKKSLYEAPKQLTNGLNSEQKQAVLLALTHSFSLITGGPGTGKTFTAAQIILQACMQKESRILLTAPTGKAVAQLENSLQKILPSLSWQSGTLHAIFHKAQKQNTPLLADVILIDESSMIDASSFAKLFPLIRTDSHVILIGDQNQLPPVESGSIFADLVEIAPFLQIPLTQLKKVLRSDSAAILEFSQSICRSDTKKATQLLQEQKIKWIDLSEGLSHEKIWDLCQKKIPPYSFSISPNPQQLIPYIDCFRLLSCMRQGPLGVDALNQFLLKKTFENTPLQNLWVFPILIQRNSPDQDLYNGDSGILVRQKTTSVIDKQLKTTDYAIFYNRQNKQEYRKIDALALPAFEAGYCLSVHKSQGSECDEIVIVLPTGSSVFGREVLYTAVTRARKEVCLITSMQTLTETLNHSSYKVSGLKSRIRAMKF
ncbi:RecBCD enzyme subunit RecD [Candidatus Rhabdochlamydia oedothoracis]|uniref:RecBCD enzyme subunit RecD n=1 Tax=Candidatus Rhabdochlamydia oedothoracis TaxID=2720720 RepID=A0ABX8V4P9_9BACT|nr:MULTISPECIES: exodeoxyribonuclease V subunit alpha [Rhabdochlamydia]KAG6559619.1 RecBCD enzyme subunit RecD [Candidatus Rhabdochlamydia sp. W815]QYF48008.1 RecBCD enzyme subunit RecD [Candidatus Rhabdochlamydia oedothoracis]